MNMFKKNGGFTLVELIVVIAILAILASVAVPAYNGYINKAKEAGDTQIISAVNTAIQAATAATDNVKVTAKLGTGNKIEVEFADDNDTDGDAAKATADYGVFIGSNDTTLKYYDTIAQDADTNVITGSKTK